MIERIWVVIKNMRRNVAGSLKKTIPIITAPTASMPVHTGYTVPIGIVLAARAIRYILKASEARNPPHHQYCATPDTVFVFPRQNVNATSISPANIRIIQFITSAKIDSMAEASVFI